MRLQKLQISGFKSFSDRSELAFDRGRHRHRRPERLRQEQRGRRHRLGAGRAEREEPARRPDDGRDLQRQRGAQGDRGRGSAADALGRHLDEREGGRRRPGRRGAADRARRRSDPAAVPVGRERVPDQRRTGAAEGRPRAADGHRPRRQGLRDHRAGEDRPDPEHAPDRPAAADRRGGRRHEVQGPPARGRAEARSLAAEPHAHRRHHLRSREAAGRAQAPGGQGAPLQAAARGAAAVGEGALRPALPRAGGCDRVGAGAPGRAPRGRGRGGRAAGGGRGRRWRAPGSTLAEAESRANAARDEAPTRASWRSTAGRTTSRSANSSWSDSRPAAARSRTNSTPSRRGASRPALALARAPRGGPARGGRARPGGRRCWRAENAAYETRLPRLAGARVRRRAEAPGRLRRDDGDQLAAARDRQRAPPRGSGWRRNCRGSRPSGRTSRSRTPGCRPSSTRAAGSCRRRRRRSTGCGPTARRGRPTWPTPARNTSSVGRRRAPASRNWPASRRGSSRSRNSKRPARSTATRPASCWPTTRDAIRQFGSLADYLEVDRGYERAVEAYLGDLLQHVLVPDHDEAARGLALVREHNAGRCGFLVAGGDVAPAGSPAAPPLEGLVPLASVVRVTGEHAAFIQAAIGHAWIAAVVRRARSPRRG